MRKIPAIGSYLPQVSQRLCIVPHALRTENIILRVTGVPITLPFARGIHQHEAPRSGDVVSDTQHTLSNQSSKVGMIGVTYVAIDSFSFFISVDFFSLRVEDAAGSTSSKIFFWFVLTAIVIEATLNIFVGELFLFNLFCIKTVLLISVVNSFTQSLGAIYQFKEKKQWLAGMQRSESGLMHCYHYDVPAFI